MKTEMKDVKIGDVVEHEGELLNVCYIAKRIEPCPQAPNGWISLWLSKDDSMKCNACYQGQFTQTLKIHSQRTGSNGGRLNE